MIEGLSSKMERYCSDAHLGEKTEKTNCHAKKKSKKPRKDMDMCFTTGGERGRNNLGIGLKKNGGLRGVNDHCQKKGNERDKTSSQKVIHPSQLKKNFLVLWKWKI